MRARARSRLRLRRLDRTTVDALCSGSWLDEDEARQAWAIVRERTIADGDRDLSRFEAFWRFEPGIPDDLRRHLRGYLTANGAIVGLLEDDAPPAAHAAMHAAEAEYVAHIAARRAWLRSHAA